MFTLHIRRVLVIGLASVALLLGNFAPQSAFDTSGRATAATMPLVDIQLFASESAAQKHCPADIVVWLNTNSGIYHLKGERWYGRTKHGAYVCQKEANAAGYRETRNGQ